MWLHPLDILLFVVAAAGTFLYGTKIFVTLGSTLDARETPNLDVTCWAPAYFQEGHILYAHSTCASKFAKVLQGQDPDALGISSSIDGDPSVNATRAPVEEAPFRQARSVYGGDGGAGHWQEKGRREPAELPVNHLYTTLALMCTLTLLALAIAISYGRVARSHACFLEAAWRNAISSPENAQCRDATSGGKGALLEKGNHVLGTRLEELWSANNLAVGYLVFQVVLLLAWLLMSMSCYHGATQVVQPKMSTIPRMYQTASNMDGGEASASSQGGVTENSGVSHSRDASGPHSTDQGEYTGMTESSRDSGVFLCDFSISARVHASFYTYTIQCNYDVRRPVGPLGVMATEKQWGMIFTGGTTLSLLVSALILVHLMSFFVLSPLSRQRGLLLVLERLDIKPKVIGVKFGFTDLSFVSSFSTLDNYPPYVLPDVPEHPREKHSINHRSHLDMV